MVRSYRLRCSLKGFATSFCGAGYGCSIPENPYIQEAGELTDSNSLLLILIRCRPLRACLAMSGTYWEKPTSAIHSHNCSLLQSTNWEKGGRIAIAPESGPVEPRRAIEVDLKMRKWRKWELFSPHSGPPFKGSGSLILRGATSQFTEQIPNGRARPVSSQRLLIDGRSLGCGGRIPASCDLVVGFH